jgi:hypothetical protein
VQIGDQFENTKKNSKLHLDWVRGRSDTRLTHIEVDAYSDDHGYSVVLGAIEELAAACNVVLGSLGPKPGSLAMFRAKMEKPDCALVYVPSRQYNRDYSVGISDKHYSDSLWL